MSSSLFGVIMFWVIQIIGYLLNDNNEFCTYMYVQCTIDLCTTGCENIKNVQISVNVSCITMLFYPVYKTNTAPTLKTLTKVNI